MVPQNLYHIAWDEESQSIVYCLYNDKGVLCKYFILDSKEAVQVSKYHDISSDLKTSLKAIEELITYANTHKVLGNEIIVRSLFDFSVTNLIRCFNSSSGRKTSLDYKKILKNDKSLLAFYEKILELRNEEIAHAGNYSNALVLYFDKKSSTPIDLKYSHLRRIRNERYLDYKELRNLILYILREVENIKSKLYERITADLKERGRDYYFSRSKEIDISTIITVEDHNGYLIAP